MRLYGSTRSPFARKAAIVALEAGVWPRIEFIQIEMPQLKPDLRLRAANPLMKLPTFVADDGTAIFDSPVICEFLSSLGARSLFPPEGEARWRALTRQALADGLLDLLVLWRAELRRPEAARQEKLFDTWTYRRDAALDRCEADAAAGASGAFDIGDVAIGVMLDYLDFRFPDLDWRGARPALAGWRERIATRPSFRATPFEADTWPPIQSDRSAS